MRVHILDTYTSIVNFIRATKKSNESNQINFVLYFKTYVYLLIAN